MIDLTQTAIELAADTDQSAAAAKLRQLANLYGTRAGEQAGNRDFGLDNAAVDMPIEAAKAMMAAEIVTKTKKFVAGVTVQSVTWAVDAQNGIISPKVVIGLV